MASVEAFDFLGVGVFATNDNQPSSREMAQVGTFLVRATGQPVYDCEGFDPPMDNVVTVRQNRVLPLRAQLTHTLLGVPITDSTVVAAPLVQVLFNSGLAPAVDVTDQALPAGQGTQGNQFVFSGGKWQFNLQTRNYTAVGTYVIKLVSGNTAEYGMQSCVAQFVIHR